MTANFHIGDKNLIIYIKKGLDSRRLFSFYFFQIYTTFITFYSSMEIISLLFVVKDGESFSCFISTVGRVIWSNSLFTNRDEQGMRLGIDKGHAYAWSRTRKGGWRIAKSPILTTTITLLRIKKKGYQSMLEIYMELNPSLCEPPYTRPLRTVV